MHVTNAPFHPFLLRGLKFSISFSPRRRMRRPLCRPRFRVWGQTISGYWRNLKMPRPNWRNSRSGFSTPSTWTDSLTFHCHVAALKMQYDSSQWIFSHDENPACVSIVLKSGWVCVRDPLWVPDLTELFYLFYIRRTTVEYDTLGVGGYINFFYCSLPQCSLELYIVIS